MQRSKKSQYIICSSSFTLLKIYDFNMEFCFLDVQRNPSVILTFTSGDLNKNIKDVIDPSFSFFVFVVQVSFLTWCLFKALVFKQYREKPL